MSPARARGISLCAPAQSSREDFLPTRRAGHPSALLTYFIWVPVCIKKVPDRKYFCQGRINDPRCHLDLQLCCTLNRIPSYPWQLTCAIRCRILGRCTPAFHCTLSGPFDDLFSARSQLAGLSVGASSPLSPPHRFR